MAATAGWEGVPSMIRINGSYAIGSWFIGLYAAETFSGLSGLGDRIATAHSPLSRNYRLGLALGRGDTLEHARESLHQVAEGVPTADAACRLADRLGVDAPILRELRRVLFEGAPIQDAVESLLTRPYRGEG